MLSRRETCICDRTHLLGDLVWVRSPKNLTISIARSRMLQGGVEGPMEIAAEHGRGLPDPALEVLHPAMDTHRRRPVAEQPADLAGDGRHGEPEECADEVGGVGWLGESVEGAEQADGADLLQVVGGLAAAA